MIRKDWILPWEAPFKQWLGLARTLHVISGLGGLIVYCCANSKIFTRTI